MLAFIDTEFTDFDNMELISIGIVTENGSSFYMENSQYDKQSCSDFVDEIVVPLLSLTPDVTQPLIKIEDSLHDWFSCFHNPVTIVIDYIGDWVLFDKLLQSKLPPMVNNRPIFLQELIAHIPSIIDIHTGSEEYFRLHPSEREHHALCDARANRWIYAQYKNRLTSASN
jgi:hypothetical protein